MDLKHDPKEGISLAEDLAGQEITLTRKRGGYALLLVLTIGFMAVMAWLGLELWSMSYAVLLMAGMALNQVKTTVALQQRALLVQRTVFGRGTSHETVPYEAIHALRLEPGRFGGHRLVVERVGQPELVIANGTRDDHEALRRAIDARRTIAPVATEAELQAPAELRALQARQRA
ncbi:MAG: hypothetical protein H6737_12220 [Alphaproteobacteria bacterium]|nr:hypothetical protein [Alphaproteobacteria bacterium]